jgi:hypothetical protein
MERRIYPAAVRQPEGLPDESGAPGRGFEVAFAEQRK